MKMAVESMEMAPREIPRLGRVRTPKLVFDGGSAAELFMDRCFTI
jgi:hypothetical protein